MSSFDLGVEGGTIVTARSRWRANLYVRDGKVALITDDRVAANTTVKASDLLVMPGMIDCHVHFMDPGALEREDFPTGSAAAARSGVTCVIEHSHVSPVRTAGELRDKAAYMRTRSCVDFGLAAHSVAGDVDSAIGAWHAGATFIKAFTCTTHGVQGHTAGDLLRLFMASAATNATCLVHCEDDSMLESAHRALVANGRMDGAVIPEWRDRKAEVVAVTTVAYLAQETGAHIAIAHASNPAVFDAVKPYRAAGADISVESCPQYFVLLEHEVDDRGALLKFAPPARAHGASDLELMWDRFNAGDVDFISSDHAPATIEQKREGSIWDAPFGLPGIDTTFSILADAASRGVITYERLVAGYSERPAKTYGLFPRKGSLAVGSDADFILVDPSREWTVNDDDIVSKAGWSPYSGRTLRGRSVATYIRGFPAAVDGEVVAQPGLGQYLPGPGLSPANRT